MEHKLANSVFRFFRYENKGESLLDNKTFKYDIVLSLDSNRFIYDICENFVTNLDNKKLMSEIYR